MMGSYDRRGRWEQDAMERLGERLVETVADIQQRNTTVDGMWLRHGTCIGSG